jgi:hypothetical protein
MTRRALGRGRLLVGIGAIVTVAGLIPLWWAVERTGGVPISGNGLQGAGIVIFLSAMAMLAVIVLPATTRDGDSAVDRPVTYVVLALLAVGAYLLRLYEISAFASLGLPLDAPGLWMTGVGLAIIAWGVAEIVVERPPES